MQRARKSIFCGSGWREAWDSERVCMILSPNDPFQNTSKAMWRRAAEQTKRGAAVASLPSARCKGHTQPFATLKKQPFPSPEGSHDTLPHFDHYIPFREPGHYKGPWPPLTSAKVKCCMPAWKTNQTAQILVCIYLVDTNTFKIK